MAILFSNATVLPMTAAGNAPRTFAGWVGVDGNRIALVTESETAAAGFRAAHPGLREFDCRGKLVMPGLVNTHCHAAMTLQRSLADDIALMEWLHDYIWPFEARQSADDVVLGMTLGVVEMLLGGVTSFVDMYYFENRCVETVRRLGIRAMLGCNYFDSNVDEVMPQAEEAVRLAAGCDRVRIALAPHSPYTVSPENLLRGKRLADKYGLHLMTHISETQDEVRIVREKYGKTFGQTLRRVGTAGAEDHRRALHPRDRQRHRDTRRAGRRRVAQPAEQHENIERRGARRADARRGCAGDGRHGQNYLLEQ